MPLYPQPKLRNPYVDHGFGVQPLEEEDYLGGGGVPPASPITPAVSAATPPASPAAIAPKPPSALDRYSDVLQRKPSMADPALKPKPIERILGALAGGAIGFGEGYMNSGPRGRVVQPGMGAQIGSAITNRRYSRANEEWQDQAAKAKEAAGIEAAQTKDRRDAEYHEARVASEKAQEKAANARTAATNAPKPVAPRDRYVNTAAGLYDTVEKKLVDGTAPPPKAEPAAKPTLTETNAEREKEADRLQLKGDDRLFYVANGKLPSRKQPKAAAAKPATTPQGTPQADPDEALVQAVLNGTAKMTDFSQKTRERIAPKVDARRNELPPNFTAGQKNDLATMETTEKLIDQVLEYSQDGLDGVGPIAGRLGAAGTALFGSGSEEAKNVRALVGNIRGTIQKLRAGTALSKTEKAQLDTYTPDISESAESVVNKLNGLKNYIATLRQSTMKYSARDAGKQGGGSPKVGDVVSVNGKQVKIGRIYPDGTFDGDEVK